MPAQKPGKSKQDYSTPLRFIDAVEKRFGALDWDLAAQASSCVVRDEFGERSDRFFSEKDDSFSKDWRSIRGLLFLNPPFSNIGKWAAKCAAEATPTSRILFLTPASIDANWFWKFVRPHAVIYAVSPRLTFGGETQPYPKGLQLAYFGLGATGFGRFRWLDYLPKDDADRPAAPEDPPFYTRPSGREFTTEQIENGEQLK